MSKIIIVIFFMFISLSCNKHFNSNNRENKLEKMTYTDYENSHDKRIIFTENQLSEWKDALNEATTETQKAKAERNIIKNEEELERLNKEKEQLQ